LDFTQFLWANSPYCHYKDNIQTVDEESPLELLKEYRSNAHSSNNV